MNPVISSEEAQEAGDLHAGHRATKEQEAQTTGGKASEPRLCIYTTPVFGDSQPPHQQRTPSATSPAQNHPATHARCRCMPELTSHLSPAPWPPPGPPTVSPTGTPATTPNWPPAPTLAQQHTVPPAYVPNSTCNEPFGTYNPPWLSSCWEQTRRPSPGLKGVMRSEPPPARRDPFSAIPARSRLLCSLSIPRSPLTAFVLPALSVQE